MRSLQSELARIRGEDFVPKPEPTGYTLFRQRATGYEGDALPRVDEAPPKRQHRERAHREWAQHEVDMNPFFHGKRKAKRGGASQTSIGMALELAKVQGRDSFIRGKGLTRKPCKYSLYVEGLRRGYLQDINKALAWAKAASSHGLHGQCIEE
jgi:hypothetical protein